MRIRERFIVPLENLWRRRRWVIVALIATTLFLLFCAGAFGGLVLDLARSRIVATSTMTPAELFTNVMLGLAAIVAFGHAWLFYVVGMSMMNTAAHGGKYDIEKKS